MTEPKPQRTARHIECTLEEYHARSEWSRSQAEDLRASPPLFHGRHISGLYPRKEGPALDTGTVGHHILTSPASVDEIVAVIPPDVLNSQGHRKGAAWKEWSEAHPDRIQMKADEMEAIRHMVRNVYAHPRATMLLANAMHYEFTVLYEDPETGLPLRARPDLISGFYSRVIVVDFKTTRALTPREFASEAVKWGYHRQEAWYREGVERFGYDIAAFLFVTVDKSPAHECRVYELSSSALQLGREENQSIRRDLAHRLETDDWTDPYGKEILTIDLPAWAYTDPWSM